MLQAYMGHSDVSTTLKYYSKRDVDDDVKARWVLDALMQEGTPADAEKILSDVESDVRDSANEKRKAG